MGFNLEMPGYNKWRTIGLKTRSVVAHKVAVHTTKSRARKVLEIMKKCAAGAPDVLNDVDLERTVDSIESNALLQKAGAVTRMVCCRCRLQRCRRLL